MIAIATKSGHKLREIVKHPGMANYHRELQSFVGFLEGKNMDFTLDGIQAYLLHLTCAPATFNKHLAAIRKMAHLIIDNHKDRYSRQEFEQIEGALQQMQIQQYGR